MSVNKKTLFPHFQNIWALLCIHPKHCHSRWMSDPHRHLYVITNAHSDLFRHDTNWNLQQITLCWWYIWVLVLQSCKSIGLLEIQRIIIIIIMGIKRCTVQTPTSSLDSQMSQSSAAAEVCPLRMTFYAEASPANCWEGVKQQPRQPGVKKLDAGKQH